MSTYVGSFDRSRLYDSSTVGTVGIVLGVVAFLIAIPPLHTRSPLWPVVIGMVAVLFGIVAVTRGGGRVGYGAIATGIVGGGLAIARDAVERRQPQPGLHRQPDRLDARLRDAADLRRARRHVLRALAAS